MFVGVILGAMSAFACSVAFSQEVQPKNSFIYPAAYQVKPLDEQVAVLRRYFPQLRAQLRGPGAESALAPLPQGAEGYFAIPRWESIAPSYGEALQKVFAALGDDSRYARFHNYRDGNLGPGYLRESKHSRMMWERLAGQQDADIVVVPAQFGLAHRGESARRAREMFKQNEFGLGAYHVGIMLLTHPERFGTGSELWVYAAGDEYSYRGDGRFELAPLFYFQAREIGFDVIWFEGTYEFYGSASGFVSQ